MGWDGMGWDGMGWDGIPSQDRKGKGREGLQGKGSDCRWQILFLTHRLDYQTMPNQIHIRTAKLYQSNFHTNYVRKTI